MGYLAVPKTLLSLRDIHIAMEEAWREELEI